MEGGKIDTETQSSVKQRAIKNFLLSSTATSEDEKQGPN